MDLTRQRAVDEHRMMWNWIADKTLEEKIKITKGDYFNTFAEEYPEAPRANCWCCEYVCTNMHISCTECPIDWSDGTYFTSNVLCEDGLFGKWEAVFKDNYEEAARIAREIANLPERKRFI